MHVQYCAKRMQTNFALFNTFRYSSTKYNEISGNEFSFKLRQNFETPIVLIKTKIHNGRANIQAKFRCNVAKFRRDMAKFRPDMAKFSPDKAKFRRDKAKFRDCLLKVRSKHLPFTVHLS